MPHDNLPFNIWLMRAAVVLMVLNMMGVISVLILAR